MLGRKCRSRGEGVGIYKKEYQKILRRASSLGSGAGRRGKRRGEHFAPPLRGLL